MRGPLVLCLLPPTEPSFYASDWLVGTSRSLIRHLAIECSYVHSEVMMRTKPHDLIEQMVKLLEEVDDRAGADFTGVGIIVTPTSKSLPIVDLRPTNELLDSYDTATGLAQISHPWHEHHDGFHVLTPQLAVEKVAQYFSPPIAPDVYIGREKLFGGRYLAALFGSMLPDVLATGISSRDFGIAVFQRGEEKFHRAAIETRPKAERTLR